MFSNTCEYAIKPAIYVAQQSSQSKRVDIKDIAKKSDSTETFTAKFLQQLIKNKVINSIKDSFDGFEIIKRDVEKNDHT